MRRPRMQRRASGRKRRQSLRAQAAALGSTHLMVEIEIDRSERQRLEAKSAHHTTSRLGDVWKLGFVTEGRASA